MRNQRLFLAVIVIAALGVGFASGFGYFRYQNARAVDAIVTRVTNTDDGDSRAVDFGLFWQVWDTLHERYVDTELLDAQKLVYGAIHGMVDSAGDPYTTFMEPVTNRKFQEEVNGSFSGVGMEIGKRDGLITIIAPIKDTPAFRAGIKTGDIILEVDGDPTDGWTVEEAVSRIRGKRGTVVRLLIGREGESEPRAFSITRDTIRIPAVDWRLIDGHVAYLQIFSFNNNVDEEFVQAAKGIIDSDADRIILDLRNNPGGLLDSAVNLASWFLLDDTLVVQEKFGNGSIEGLRSSGDGRLAALPLIILINGGSASASEILAGALHDVRNVPLIGEKTFGKGSVQQLESFYNGSALKVTIAKWLTPNGVSISDTGIAPTDAVPMDPKEYEAKGWELGTPGKDPQLDRALQR